MVAKKRKKRKPATPVVFGSAVPYLRHSVYCIAGSDYLEPTRSNIRASGCRFT